MNSSADYTALLETVLRLVKRLDNDTLQLLLGSRTHAAGHLSRFLRVMADRLQRGAQAVEVALLDFGGERSTLCREEGRMSRQLSVRIRFSFIAKRLKSTGA